MTLDDLRAIELRAASASSWVRREQAVEEVRWMRTVVLLQDVMALALALREAWGREAPPSFSEALNSGDGSYRP